MKPEDYGSQYQEHLLEEYKLYVEMADRVSHRRSVANSFFLTRHTGLFSLIMGLLGLSSGEIEGQAASLAAAVFGLPFAYVWHRILVSYRQINSAKYQVLQELEVKLPVALFDAEWEKAGRGENPKLYTPLTKTEGWVPKIFTVGYVLGIALAATMIARSAIS